jgi:acyl-CoA reductase-like NAD-dependent aldehyde dehydrogenase
LKGSRSPLGLRLVRLQKHTPSTLVLTFSLRMYVPESLWGQVKEGLVETLKTVKVGPVTEFDTFMSAVIDKKSFDRCKNYIDGAIAGKNTTIVAG